MKYRNVGDKIWIIIRKYNHYREFKGYEIIEAPITKVGTKYIYVNLGDRHFSHQPKFNKKSGVDCNESKKTNFRAFKTKEAAEQWIQNRTIDRWERVMMNAIRHKRYTILQYEEAAKVFNIEKPSIF